jgi:hypothetical protein
VVTVLAHLLSFLPRNMRLLHSRELRLEEFFDGEIPEYAILSHRWGEDEVSFQDFLEGRKRDGAGYDKIKWFCHKAAKKGYNWVWIDTCCIDKKSSAELSEAINSMFRWYQQAMWCLAYLPDVYHKPPNVMDQFRRSVWFTRGWTLQELLANNNMLFYGRDWQYIGSKMDLLEEISHITGISESHLRKFSTASIATKMSWASKRVTCRLEDMAYCLMGIFDIKMPLLYGEGDKAFYRLQQEIIKVSDDETIFAWEAKMNAFHGIFAPSPSCFAGSADIVPRQYASRARPPYAMTNKGLQIDSHLGLASRDSQVQVFWFPLNCAREGDRQPVFHLICKGDFGDGRWYRVNPWWLPSVGYDDHWAQDCHIDAEPERIFLGVFEPSSGESYALMDELMNLEEQASRERSLARRAQQT